MPLHLQVILQAQALTLVASDLAGKAAEVHQCKGNVTVVMRYRDVSTVIAASSIHPIKLSRSKAMRSDPLFINQS